MRVCAANRAISGATCGRHADDMRATCGRHAGNLQFRRDLHNGNFASRHVHPAFARCTKPAAAPMRGEAGKDCIAARARSHFSRISSICSSSCRVASRDRRKYSHDSAIIRRVISESNANSFRSAARPCIRKPYYRASPGQVGRPLTSLCVPAGPARWFRAPAALSFRSTNGLSSAPLRSSAGGVVRGREFSPGCGTT